MRYDSTRGPGFTQAVFLEESSMENSFARWSATYRACISTYFAAEKFAKPGEVPADGLYILAGLQRYFEIWNRNHGHRGVDISTLDAAAAHEIYYQYNHGRKFRRAAAALSACVANVAIDRPEFIIERHEKRQAKKEERATKQDLKSS